MSIKKYKTQTWTNADPEIREIEILSETEHFITLSHGTRVAKISDHERYFNSFEEALNHLIVFQERRCKTLQEQLTKANYILEGLKQQKFEPREGINENGKSKTVNRSNGNEL